MNKPKIISIFSGVGGMDSGFHKAGFDVVFALDIWNIACKSLKENFPKAEVTCDTIENISFTKIKQKYGQIDGVIGGPPCPPFSKSRFYRIEKKRGIEDEDGLMTVSNYFRAVEEIQPSFFLFENVHGFIFKPHLGALNLIKLKCEKLGYNLFYKVLNAADYGVPQTRHRFIAVGIKKGLKDFEFPEKTHFERDKIPKWRTAGDVLLDIDFDLDEDIKMQAGSKHKELLKLVPPGNNYLFFTKERGYDKPLFKWRSRYWSFLLKLSPNKPSWTIQASHSNNMGPFHWKNRFLRISEIKRLQSFDDDYIILGSFKDQWRQVGNAVPPHLAFVLAKQIKHLYYNDKTIYIKKDKKAIKS